MMYWEGINQRNFPRANYKCLIYVVQKGQEEKIDTVTVNIGAGGICVELEKRFELYEDVSLEIYIKEGKSPVTCTGTVVWVIPQYQKKSKKKGGHDIGIEFLNITKEDRNRVKDLVEEILSAKA